MKNTTVIAASTADISDDDLELQTFSTPGLTPGFKREPSFLWEFPAFSRWASPLPASKAI
ncbi:MAG: hypothetical protein LBB26_00320 [Puniceicoccales bacterium]|jgi:hypothetical protein|nr:hypothetical protein [Puniceicoccales bacterium]